MNLVLLLTLSLAPALTLSLAPALTLFLYLGLSPSQVPGLFRLPSCLTTQLERNVLSQSTLNGLMGPRASLRIE